MQQIASQSLTKLFEHISTSDQLAEDYNHKKEDMEKADFEMSQASERRRRVKIDIKLVKRQKEEADRYAQKVEKLVRSLAATKGPSKRTQCT